jgi:hypothetical protein
MRWLKRKLVKWLLKDVEVEELTVKKLKVGDKTVTIDTNSLILPSLTADPTLAEGKLWYRADLDRLQYAIDTATKREIPYGTINVDTHASRHVAGGADAIPSGGIARSQLEYPTVDVNFGYLANIEKTQHLNTNNQLISYFVTTDSFADKAVEHAALPTSGDAMCAGRVTTSLYYYATWTNPSATTADHELRKLTPTYTTLATEAVDIGYYYWQAWKLSLSGSTLKSYRGTAYISATDTSLASGYMGIPLYCNGAYTYNMCNNTDASIAHLRAPSSALSPALAILEMNIEGSGKPDDPFRPLMSRSLVEEASLTSLPDFLYQEAKKYGILKAKGFTDDEIKALFGYIPQHQVDLDAVTFGSFELHADKAPTAIVVVTGDNPYKVGAIDRQKAKAKRVFMPPKDYGEAVSLYNTLKKDYPHWLAGKDNFAYQTLGLEVLDWFQNIDFYYGELIEHKTHYSQLKQVPDFEIRNRLNELIDKLSKVTVLVDERDKHINKAREVLRRGW